MSDERYPDDRDLYLEALDGWADFYVEGRWSLEKFEAHADAMRESMFHPKDLTSPRKSP